jgi:hypothetical protein
VQITGQTHAPVAFAPGVEIPAGPVSIELQFVGGAAPTVRELRCLAAPLILTIEDHKLRLGGQEVGTAVPMDAVEGLLDHLHDLAVRVEAVAGDELWVKIAPGVAATIPSRATITVDAATRGPPNRPRLRRPLVISVGGAGLSIRLPGSRWLKALASVAIRGASLAPDGEVELTGHGPGALDRVVGAGLRKTSSHLSELVRRSPQFAKVRSFLGPGVGPEDE